ncbi:hypothetical protein [Bdellovibrio sp. KM01]|uniref:hypothetical protein n=1 Tax=Bdellovibrio sp. KM01 TaxID=2748865 RepID=UPI0015EA8F67|nr:hypothetical protein [Bdellovibrio sp. KM01]QLY26475.1 hypothetical protein HW988_05490 [Bdellovibrio sp. KM01]
MKATVAVILTVIGLQAHAQGQAAYVGNDSKGNECSVTLDTNNNIVSYRYVTNDGHGGYGFRLTEDFKNAVKQGQSPITLNEGGLGGANLKIWINSDGSMDAKFSNLVIQRSSCEEMHRQ